MDIQGVITRGYITKKEAETLDSNYLRKINLIDSDDDVEGIWVNLLSKENTDIYDNGDSHDEHFFGVLQNDALAFAPNKSWGITVECITQGDSRAIAHAKKPEIYDDFLQEYSELF